MISIIEARRQVFALLPAVGNSVGGLLAEVLPASSAWRQVFALLPAVGNFVGGLLAEVLPASSAWRNWTLHAAVGVALAVVSVRIIPEALTALAGWQIAIAFVAGGLRYLGIDAVVTNRATARRSKMWMIYIAVAADFSATGS